VVKEKVMMTAAPDVFWIDHDYDRERASDGVSRYGAYLRDARFEPWTDDDQHVALAEFAWERATGPVMSTGYVRCHPRILTARLARSGWDGSLIARVDVLTGQPEYLRRPRSDDVRGFWHDWPDEYSLARDQIVYYEPGTEELAKRGRYALASVSLRFTVPSGDLPDPRGHGASLGICREAVAVVVRELNRAVGPVLARMGEC
jgi:hypothetical protein